MLLYADMCGGAAGDMITAAMLDCGMPLPYLKSQIEKLNLPDVSIDAEKVLRRGISCTKFNVHTKETHHHRKFAVIKKLIEDSSLSPFVKDTAVKTFRRLAEAEGFIHNMPPENVHFHEVGAADSIVDIVSAAVGLEYFRADGFYLSDFVFGRGAVESAHGIIPVPAPATVKLTEGFTFRQLDIHSELTTPTAAAILTASSLGKIPASSFTAIKTGFGAGFREPEGVPPYFRLWLVESALTESSSNEIVVETSIDDMSGEFYPFLMDRLFEAGAKDVIFTPVYMKKRRPGVLITATAEENDLEKISEAFFLHSSTIGFRWHHVHRSKLQRESVEINTKWGKISAKKVNFKGKTRIYPEFESCRQIAEQNYQSLFDVYNEVNALGNPHD